MFRCRFIFVAMLLMSATALAVPVVMTASDTTAPTSSFNNAGSWSPSAAPSAGNVYYTLGYLMRSPVVGGVYQTGDWTFGGTTLVVGGGTGGGAFVTGNGAMNNNSLIFKQNGLNLTVNNLILDASYIRDGLGSGQACSMNGNIFVTSNGGGFCAQSALSINSAINGSGKLYIGDNGSGEAGRVVIITSGLNTYNGSIQLNGQSAARGRLTFADNSLMNFVIGANGVNNSISGTGTAIFNGDFWFNLSGASKVLGDSWTIASATSQTFSDTFTVLGFTPYSGDYWLKWITPSVLAYKFDESTGILNVVPEPATMTLLGLGGLSLLRVRKRR